jgi:dipeptidyl aminopeptidase/acylaminoacyl peptidase
MGLAFYNIDYSKLEWILSPKWDIELIDLNRNGDVLAWSINENGYSTLFIKKLESGHVQQVLGIPRGVLGKIKLSGDGKKIGLLISTPKTPYDLYILDIETENIYKLTNSLTQNIPQDIMADPQFIHYQSFDNLQIPALLYRPRNIQNNTSKVAAVISIHGGPMSQERPIYHYAGMYQYLANQGVAILAPNFRGSTGYGKSFEKSIYHDWGGKDLKDIEYAVKWLLEQDWIDSNRLGVFGKSFGGFATLSCISRLPQYRWKAAVDMVGPSNLITFARTVPKHWKWIMKDWLGDSEKEEDFLKERSPFTYVDNINTDIMIIQGANDPRVAKAESDQIVKRLRANGRNVEYIVFDDEGHGFTKYSNLLRAFKSSAEFLVRKLTAT